MLQHAERVSDGVTTYSAVRTQPGWQSPVEVLWSEDNVKVSGDKRCEHYACELRVHQNNIKYSRYANGNPAQDIWTSPAFWVFGYTGGVKNTSQGTAENPLMGLPSLFSQFGTVPETYSSTDLSRKVIVDDPGISGLVEQSLSAMLPGIRPKMSLLNSIYELKDVPGMAKQWKRVYRSFRRFDRILADRCPRYRANQLRRRFTLRHITRTSSDGYLSWMFGYKPMYDDIVSLIGSLRSYRQKVSKLIADEGRPKVAHFEQSLSNFYVDQATSRTTAIGSACNGSYCDKRFVTHVNPMFRASIRYSYTLPDWAKVDANLSGLMDVLGVNLNPRILWAAIPYSFVFDWVIGIGRWLDQFKVRNLEPRTNIQRYCISIELVRSTLISTQLIGDTVTNLNSGDIPVSSCLESAYFRTPLTPDWLRSIRLSGLSSTEFSLGSALLGARLH